MLPGLVLMLAVLILLFGSVVQPFTIQLSLPLAIGGVVAALILTGNPISLPLRIGILMLMGIVTKNAILLIDVAVEMRVRGRDRFETVVKARHQRGQPIVMTSIAMAAGMLPSALGVGEGGSFRAPMAVAVLGGIIASTVLSLVVVLSFFPAMDDPQRSFAWAFGRFGGAKHGDEALSDRREPAADLAAEIIALKARLEERLARLTADGTHLLLHAAEQILARHGGGASRAGGAPTSKRFRFPFRLARNWRLLRATAH